MSPGFGPQHHVKSQVLWHATVIRYWRGKDRWILQALWPASPAKSKKSRFRKTPLSKIKIESKWHPMLNCVLYMHRCTCAHTRCMANIEGHLFWRQDLTMLYMLVLKLWTQTILYLIFLGGVVAGIHHQTWLWEASKLLKCLTGISKKKTGGEGGRNEKRDECSAWCFTITPICIVPNKPSLSYFVSDNGPFNHSFFQCQLSKYYEGLSVKCVKENEVIRDTTFWCHLSVSFSFHFLGKQKSRLNQLRN